MTATAGFIPYDAVNTKSSRKFERQAEYAPEDFHKHLFELEADGEWIVQRVPEPYVEVMTKFGRTKKIPLELTWHHKSCGQCGHIPGYSTSIFWLNRKLNFKYLDPTDQTSCTAWNYYASATSNAAAQAGVGMRNSEPTPNTRYYNIMNITPLFLFADPYDHQLLHHADL